AGNDVFEFGATFDSADTVDGGSSGVDTLELNGDYSGGLTITTSMLQNVDSIFLADGHDYKFVVQDGVAPNLSTLQFNGSFLVSNSLYVDGSAETDNAFALIGGGGNDTLIGGG